MNNQKTELSVGILGKKEIEKMTTECNLICAYDPDSFEPCSYDMRIGTIFRDGKVINESHDESNDTFEIKPGEIVSVLTLEELKLPEDICATVFPINEQSRKGLMVLNPGHVDPGFKGPLSVKALNLRKVSTSIRRKDKIFTIIFEKLPKITEGYPIERLKSREQRERFYSQQDLEVSPKGLFEIIKISKDDSFTTKQDVKSIITKHWMSWLMVILSFVAAFAAISAVIIGLYSIRLSVNNNRNKNSGNNLEFLSKRSSEISQIQNIDDEELGTDITDQNYNDQSETIKLEKTEQEN